MATDQTGHGDGPLMLASFGSYSRQNGLAVAPCVSWDAERTPVHPGLAASVEPRGQAFIRRTIMEKHCAHWYRSG